mmetsp:Transcript_18096/g.26756  ORF Transcript_18096/g.26756 Transcript_18096/m.26756 type:complete len:109 (+) Transcript_18096:495-821(+)
MMIYFSSNTNYHFALRLALDWWWWMEEECCSLLHPSPPQHPPPPHPSITTSPYGSLSNHSSLQGIDTLSPSTTRLTQESTIHVIALSSISIPSLMGRHQSQGVNSTST